jgi:hypothetical protein
VWTVREDPDDLELAVAPAATSAGKGPAPVKGYTRYERGRPEQVRPYSRLWWIPHPDWMKGEQRWVTAGEAAWRERGAAAEAAEDRAEGESDLPYWARQSGFKEPITRTERAAAEGTVGKGDMHERPVHGYARPNPERLVRPPRKGGYARPEDHPAFQATPMNKENIKDAYRKTTAAEKYQGRRWYPDMARLAWALGGGDAEKGAKVLSAYSPQAGWPLNLFNAARALAEGRPLKPGEGVVLPVHTQMATKALAPGATFDQVFKGPKTNAFGYLGSMGVDHPADPLGAVVVDRHALNVAAGGERSDEELKPASGAIGSDPFYSYVADMYREAAADLSEETGEEISPSELQAITWLRQQKLNEARTRARAAAGDRKAKGAVGLYTAMRNHWTRWEQYARDHGIRTELGSTALAPQPITKDEVAASGGLETAGGQSRPVSAQEFFDVADQGRQLLNTFADNSSPITPMAENFDSIVTQAWDEVQQSWGGVTIDPHTGQALEQGADKYAVTAKPAGVATISIPEASTEAQFRKAMDRALKEFGPLLQRANYHLGVFHDDATGRIDIDPVAVVGTQAHAEAIGAYTRNIGGAYHFASGNGYFPPHVP